jgi:hypothetical protein
MVGSYWRKHTHWIFCLAIGCNYARGGLTVRRAHKMAMHHEKFHSGHNVTTDLDRGVTIKTRHGFIA